MLHDPMDDIQKRADDKSWDQKQDRRISDANRKVEAGVSGEALATLHGLHVPSDDEPHATSMRPARSTIKKSSETRSSGD